MFSAIVSVVDLSPLQLVKTTMHDDPPLTISRATRVLAERIRPAIHQQSMAFDVTSHQLPGDPTQSVSCVLH